MGNALEAVVAPYGDPRIFPTHLPASFTITIHTVSSSTVLVLAIVESLTDISELPESTSPPPVLADEVLFPVFADASISVVMTALLVLSITVLSFFI